VNIAPADGFPFLNAAKRPYWHVQWEKVASSSSWFTTRQYANCSPCCLGDNGTARAATFGTEINEAVASVHIVPPRTVVGHISIHSTYDTGMNIDFFASIIADQNNLDAGLIEGSELAGILFHTILQGWT